MYAFIQDVPIGEDVYEQIKAKLGPEPPAGLVMHLVLRREDGKLRYVDVWKDKASCDAAFDERIHPAVFGVFSEIGFVPQGEARREEMPAVHVWLGKP
jgi:hypothetical protein